VQSAMKFFGQVIFEKYFPAIFRIIAEKKVESSEKQSKIGQKLAEN
jgi:hypothetical protein